ncbi:MAG: zinc-dependent metalloprotease [Oligoflexales bacterium]|nr:zinc-dependent metalloprotease [Oligoflexales bacterium]
MLHFRVFAFHPTLMSILLFSAFACAKNPKPLIKEGEIDSLYSKSLFDGQSYRLSEIKDSSIQNFVKVARAKENPQDFQLIADSKFRLLQDEDVVTFNVEAKFLRMYSSGSDGSVADWPIEAHCNIVQEHNAKGEATRFQVADCSKPLPINSFSHIKVNYNDVTVRSLPQDLHMLRSKDQIENLNSSGLLQIATSEFINQGESTSRELKDGKYIIKGSSLSLAKELVVDPKIRGFNILGPVKYALRGSQGLIELNSELAPDIEVLGDENAVYPINIRFAKNHLILEKITDKSSIASVEQTYAYAINESQLAVPIVGFPITKYRIEHKVVNGLKSAVLTGVVVDNIEDATHIKIDQNKFMKFKRKNKLDVFAKDFLKENDEWFYTKTIIDAPLDSSDKALGGQLGVQIDGRVRVHRTKSSLQLVDVNIPQEALDATGDDMQVLLEIPAKWIDYRLVTSGPEAFLVEEQLEDGDAAARQWYERNSVSFEFNRADNLRDARSDLFKLNRLEISEGYIGFDVYHSDSQLTYKYSLAKAPPKISNAKVYHLVDQERFGYFRTIRNFYQGVIYENEEDLEKNILVSRMYPKADSENDNKPTIKFYLTDNLPEDPMLRRASEIAIEAWNEAFHKAAEGTGLAPITVILGKNRVPIGDVRFNKITFFDYDRYSGGVLGRGPSVNDNRTGEIFTATNNIYLLQYREGIWNTLSDYIRLRLGQYEDAKLSHLDHVIPKVPESATILTNRNALNSTPSVSALTMQDFIEVANSREVTPSSASFYAISDFMKEGVSIESLDLGKAQATPLPRPAENAGGLLQQILREQEYMASTAGSCNAVGTISNSIADIEKLCFDQKGGATKDLAFHQYMEALLALKESGSDQTQIAELKEKAFKSCSDLILEKKLVATLVHEFGHNFGLTHNFKGSTDKDNFPKDSYGNILSASSSVMDYPHNDVDRAVVPGPYDLAAIRYAYYDTIEAKEPLNNSEKTTELVKLEGRSINDAITKASQTSGKTLVAKSYRMCNENGFFETEGYGIQRPKNDPNCRRWDQGVGPRERAEEFIKDFYAFILTRVKRLERNSGFRDVNLAREADNRHILPLKFIYDHYRFLLRSEISQVRADPYLINISSEQLNELILASKKRELLEYQDAVENVIYPFLRELAFSPILYCAAKSSEGVEFLEFENQRIEIFNETKDRTGLGLVVNNCDDVGGYLKSVGKEFETIASLGNLFNDLPFSPDVNDMITRLPIKAGLGRVRVSALTALAGRDIYTQLNSVTNFRPSMLDESEKLAEIKGKFVERAVAGENITKLLIDENVKGYLPSYQKEDRFLIAMADFIKRLSRSPNHTFNPAQDLISEILRPNDLRAALGISAQVNLDQELTQRGFSWITSANGFYHFAHPDRNPGAFALINQIRNIQMMARQAAADPQAGADYLKFKVEYDVQRAMLTSIVLGDSSFQ